jgi:hypothetical protein
MKDLLIAFERAGKIRDGKKDPRRHQERKDFNMIGEDHTAMANLPRQAQHHEFPKDGGYFEPMWD